MEQDWLFYDSHDLFFRNPFGAVPCNKKVTFQLKVQNGESIDRISLRIRREGNGEIAKEMSFLEPRGEEFIFTCDIQAPPIPSLLWYYFCIVKEGRTYFYGSNPQQTGGKGVVTESSPVPYQITVYKEDIPTPQWFQKAVIYQIFVDRFYNGSEDGRVLNPRKNTLIHSHWDNTPIYIRETSGKVARWDFFGGNLAGVKKKLPYLKGLGISAIYFNPIFEASSNHKYDTADYHNIDLMFGDNDLFQELCRSASELGISIILDGVFSHTGSDSIYFNKEGNYDSLGAYQSQDSPYYSWYRFKDFPKDYECWWGIETLPNVNELETSYQDFIIFQENSVLKHWQRSGVKGWRLDVADELPPVFIKNFRKTMKEIDQESILIGEVWEDASNKISYGERREYLLGEELDAATNYPFRNILLDFILGNRDGQSIQREMMSLFENYPSYHFYSTMNITGSHDVPRILTVLGDSLAGEISSEEKIRLQNARIKLASLWQLTFPGIPCIYYGDEAGLEGGQDPQNRRTFPWGKENKDILNWYKEIISLRNHYDVLQTGYWIPLYAQGDIYCYLRTIENNLDVFHEAKKNNTAVVLLNRNTNKEINISLDLSRWCQGRLVDPLHHYEEIILDEGLLNITLQPLKGRLLIQDRWGDSLKNNRESGVLLHVTSLHSDYGVGGLGKEAYEFAEFLNRSGQKLWQILPLNPPALGDSPYQCFSAFAGNPLLIDPDELNEEFCMTGKPLKTFFCLPENMSGFEEVRENKDRLLREAFQNFTIVNENLNYARFCEENKNWLHEYAFFMALKKHFQGKVWTEWDQTIALREEKGMLYYNKLLQEEIAYHKFVQFVFFSQWHKLKKYTNSLGIKIIGDLPIFVSHDSSDVWANQELFELDHEGRPLKVAGVPPDYFSETGQRWGNPHYRWDELEKNNYQWWKDRLATLGEMVDMIRIDHFIGFVHFWEIPAEEETAVNGCWVDGPGEKFFSNIKKDLGDIPLIAENLGHLTPEVEDLRVNFSFPGMKVMQFIMNGQQNDSFYIPLYDKDTVVYTGTHDNDTILGWYNQINNFEYQEKDQDAKEICWNFIELAFKSNAQRVIIPLQDILCLGSKARMNIPGTIENNWKWRFQKGDLTNEMEATLKSLTNRSNR